ncbi:hypothetical protein DEIPH_ctg060orf0033 [Deinococcus phoenicis]|uniref:Uncharacterized protein n=1 Tax=Deinococcus phoenicis TaxID=1476583 RepID=A0A016QLL7_9DEIO|nr:hypothetical protein [Deinococcus phoenicis]EYB66953.1 hypothetical protein DEIPH_ctg060orf0033 [Deinococcus phoenicis]
MQNGSSNPRNITRTWKVDLYGGWGDGPSATVYLGSHTVTLNADADGKLSAEIDGEPQASIDRAVSYLNWAKADGRLELLEEVRAPDPEPLTLAAPVIGKARAAKLHKIMGLVGLPSAQHYALAAAALGEWVPVPSLADLTEREARTVWAHLCNLYPSARAIVESLNARSAHAA